MASMPQITQLAGSSLRVTETPGEGSNLIEVEFFEPVSKEVYGGVAPAAEIFSLKRHTALLTQELLAALMAHPVNQVAAE